VQVWINGDDESNTTAIAAALQSAVKKHSGSKLLGFVIFTNPGAEPGSAMTRRLERIAAAGKIEKVALAYLAGPTDPAIRLYRLNTDERIRNTVFVYRQNRIVSKLVNLTADGPGLQALDRAIQAAVR
jgi:hypothetical protein